MSDPGETYGIEVLHDREADFVAVVQTWSGGDEGRLILDFDDAERLEKALLAITGSSRSVVSQNENN